MQTNRGWTLLFRAGETSERGTWERGGSRGTKGGKTWQERCGAECDLMRVLLVPFLSFLSNRSQSPGQSEIMMASMMKFGMKLVSPATYGAYYQSIVASTR
jgi:hypothetical protein